MPQTHAVELREAKRLAVHPASRTLESAGKYSEFATRARSSPADFQPVAAIARKQSHLPQLKITLQTFFSILMVLAIALGLHFQWL
jgi:hypothetical protein